MRSGLRESILFEVDDSDSQAVLDIAGEVEPRRTWRERAADIVCSVRLFLVVLWYTKILAGRG